MLNGRVVTNDEISGTASAIIETYGHDAFAEAKSRAETMWQLGDKDSFETWSRIAAAIEQIE